MAYLLILVEGRWIILPQSAFLKVSASPGAAFYERLGYEGEPDANPEHLFFEIEFE